MRAIYKAAFDPFEWDDDPSAVIAQQVRTAILAIDPQARVRIESEPFYWRGCRLDYSDPKFARSLAEDFFATHAGLTATFQVTDESQIASFEATLERLKNENPGCFEWKGKTVTEERWAKIREEIDDFPS